MRGTNAQKGETGGDSGGGGGGGGGLTQQAGLGGGLKDLLSRDPVVHASIELFTTAKRGTRACEPGATREWTK